MQPRPCICFAYLGVALVVNIKPSSLIVRFLYLSYINAVYLNPTGRRQSRRRRTVVVFYVLR